MYNFSAFAYDQISTALNIASPALKTYVEGYDPNIVSCVFVDPCRKHSSACMNACAILRQRRNGSKMVVMEHMSMVEAIMISTADRKWMPCAKDGRGVDIFFKNYESIFTIVLDMEVTPLVFEKSLYVAHISKTPREPQATHSIEYEASCSTSEGAAFVTLYKRVE